MRKRPEGRRASGKVRLFNGKTGAPFEQKVTVGFMYILKLAHLVDDKGLGLLGRMFGDAWASRYLREVLFPA